MTSAHPRTRRPTAPERIRRWIVRLCAVVTLLVLVAGVPYGLTFIGSPLPGLQALAVGDVSDTAIIAVLACVTWVAWAQMALAVLVNVIAAARNLSMPQHIPGVLPGQQRLAAALVGAVVVTAPLAAALQTLPSVTPSPPATAQIDQPLNAVTIAAVTPTTTRAPTIEVTITATGAQTLWDLADEYLGDGQRWYRIWNLNEGRNQPDGTVMTDPNLLRIGWTLTVPDTAPTRPDSTSTKTAADEVTVHPGQTLTSIADDTHTTWQALWDLNRGRTEPHRQTFTDPDLIQPGWTLTVPAVDTDEPPQSPADPTTEPSTKSPESSTTPTTRTPRTTGTASETSAAPDLDSSSSPTTTEDPAATTQTSSTASATRATTGQSAPTTAADPPSSTAPLSAVPTPPSLDSTAPQAADPTSAPARSSAPSTTTATDLAAPVDRVTPVADGVQWPGGWMPWTLAGAVAAGTALLWLQRRRRHVPGSLDTDPLDLPEPITDLHRIVQGHQPPDLLATTDPYTATGNGFGPLPDTTDDPFIAPTFLPLPEPEDRTDAENSTPEVGFTRPVTGIGQALDTEPTSSTGTDLSEQAAAVPPNRPLSPGGTGLTGPGATPAARGALVTALSAGGPRNPDAHHEVVIDRTTLTDLTGAPLDPDHDSWPRLNVTDTLDASLDLLEERLLHRSRILHDNAVDDIAALRRTNPTEEPLPPILLISNPPNTTQRARARTVLMLGARLDLSALFLGPWDSTIELDSDGHPHQPTSDPADANLTSTDPSSTDSSSTDPSGSDPAPAAQTLVAAALDRWAVLDQDSTRAILSTLYEAHTGHRPIQTATATTTPDPAAVPDLPPLSLVPEPPADGSTAAAEGTGKAQLNVFGEPRIEDITAPGKPLRAKALEIAVFLACHPDGVDTRTIGDHLEPDVRLRYADTRVHTNVSNLRHVLGRAAGARRIGYITKTHGKYRIDRAHVTVDLWSFQELISRAVTAPVDQRISLLRQACDLYTGPLAQSCDYDWVEPHRERARQHASEAHLVLAETLLPDDPQSASDVLDHAIRLDRYNEELYRTAMRARHRLGDHDGIRTLLRALTSAMSDLDAEPDETTRQLAHELQQSDGNGTAAEPVSSSPRDAGL